MASVKNLGTAIGRVSQLKAFDENSDGSFTMAVTIAVDDNFLSKDPKNPTGPKVRNTNFIQLRHYIAAGKGKGPWANVHVGNRIAVNYRVKAQPYTDDAGVKHYPQTLEIEGGVEYLDTLEETSKLKSVKDTGSDAPADAEFDTVAARTAQLEAQGVEPDYSNQEPFGSEG